MKINKMKLRMLDSGQSLIAEKKLLNLPVEETTLLKLSKEIFDDPEPCMIHRSAIMKKMYVEIYDFLIDLYDQKQLSVQWEEVPNHLKSYFSNKEFSHIHSIEVK